MKTFKNFSMTAALLAASTTALAHPGHEAIGDVLHVEYLFTAITAATIALGLWKIRNNND